VFGVLLIVTAVKMLLMNVEHGSESEPRGATDQAAASGYRSFSCEHFLVRAGSRLAGERVPACRGRNPVVEGARPARYCSPRLALA